MSFNSRASLDQFYVAMGKNAMQFKQHIDTKFLPDLKKPFIRGGAKRSDRIAVIQEAVDALQTYGALNAPDAADKRVKFEMSYRAVFSGNLPANSHGAGVQQAKLQLAKVKLEVLEEKFKLLDYWSARAKGHVKDPEWGADWQLHELLQHDPMKVRPILQIMLGDAASVLKKPMLTTEMKTWMGADHSVEMQITKTNISRALRFEAMARAGVQGNVKAEVVYKGLKGEASAELFAGARGKVAANVDINPDGFRAGGTVQCDVGIIITAEAKLDILDVLELTGDLEALAGAQLKGEAKVVLTRSDGIEVTLGAEAFAGLRIKGSASGKLKLGDREITYAKVEGSAWAGAGASAGVGFKCGIFGQVSFKAKAGAAAGIGAEGGFELSVDFHNIKWGAEALMWAYINEHGFKNQGKVFFLPIEENVQMCDRARDALWKMMGDQTRLYNDELAILDRWNILHRRVSAHAVSR